MPTGSGAFGNHKRNPILDRLGFLDMAEHERAYILFKNYDIY